MAAADLKSAAIARALGEASAGRWPIAFDPSRAHTG
jgi:hypothetical protein